MHYTVSGVTDGEEKLVRNPSSLIEAQKTAIEMLSFHDFDFIMIEVFTECSEPWQVTRHTDMASIHALHVYR